MDIKPDNKFKQSLLLIVIGVLLMSALLNFSEVLGVFNLMIGPVHAAIGGRGDSFYNERTHELF